MHGSTMETKDDTIDKSFCVLICVCEKYRLSENCQLEAKYALKKKKPFIPFSKISFRLHLEGDILVRPWIAQKSDFTKGACGF